MNPSYHSDKPSRGGCACESNVCRPRYFPRQLITPDELSLEADYFRDMFRRLRRLLWGWGVVCGAAVCRAPKCQEPGDTSTPDCEPWKVLIKPGYIIGPCGDEIIIPCDTIVDLCKPETNGIACPEPCDPWCIPTGDVPTERTLCLAIKYQQIMTRPVRVQPCGCGCDDSPCEYSRWCDGYEIGLLPDCPECAQAPPAAQTDLRSLLVPDQFPDCPDCPDSPWVCLAKIKVDQRGCVVDISNCSCRRLLPTLRHLWSKCQQEPCTGEEAKEIVPEAKEKDKASAAVPAKSPEPPAKTATPPVKSAVAAPKPKRKRRR